MFLSNVQSEYQEMLSKSRARQIKDQSPHETRSPSTRTAPSNSSTSSLNNTPSQPSTTNPSTEKRWLLRFQELETRLKAEQEGRALDQKGAKLRLDEFRKENEELRNEIKGKESDTDVPKASSSGITRVQKEKGTEAGGV
jgi:hypothetical protein